VADDDLGSVSGLPPELGIDDDLGRAQQRLRIRTDTRRYGKPVTIVTGFDDVTGVDLDELASTLKRALACGGTVEDGEIVLQGDHVARVPDLLRERGFAVDA
jgi:translation initiation factor 1